MSATHVIIRGHVFDYAEKAPFVPSGKSVLGALEYDETTDKVKCHECGVGFSGLGAHIRQHGLDRKEYNRKHGLRFDSAISGIKSREKRGPQAFQIAQMAKARDGGRKGQAARFGKSPRRGVKTPEIQNLEAKCKAQILFRVQMMAYRSGHTPGGKELQANGISASSIERHFGSIGKCMEALGLAPNDTGHRANPVPKQVMQEWEDRMPWPEGYFGVNPLEQKRG